MCHKQLITPRGRGAQRRQWCEPQSIMYTTNNGTRHRFWRASGKAVHPTDGGLHYVCGAYQAQWLIRCAEACTILWRAPSTRVHATDGDLRHTVAHTRALWCRPRTKAHTACWCAPRRMMQTINSGVYYKRRPTLHYNTKIQFLDSNCQIYAFEGLVRAIRILLLHAVQT